jgi:glycosyltransferase involved in cell wall biosynthesis
MHTKFNILIAGPIAPPFGGISIHIKRLAFALKPQFNISFIDEAKKKKSNIFNIYSLNFFAYLKLVLQSDLVFIHSGNRWLKKLHLIVSKLFRKKTIITIHGYGKKRNFVLKFWDEIIYRLANHIVLVNAEINQKIDLPLQKCSIQHAFLPPNLLDESPLPESLYSKIVTAKAEGKFILVGNASRLDLFNGEDLYGVDMAIEAASQLLAENENFLMVFSISELGSGTDLYNTYIKKIESAGLKDNFIFYTGILSFPQLIELSDIVIRPTKTDGDSLSVREALYFKKPIIASDVVLRPKGTITFKTRNFEDFIFQIKTCLSQKKAGINPNPVQNQNEDFSNFYINLIHQTLNK